MFSFVYQQLLSDHFMGLYVLTQNGEAARCWSTGKISEQGVLKLDLNQD